MNSDLKRARGAAPGKTSHLKSGATVAFTLTLFILMAALTSDAKAASGMPKECEHLFSKSLSEVGACVEKYLDRESRAVGTKRACSSKHCYYKLELFEKREIIENADEKPIVLESQGQTFTIGGPRTVFEYTYEGHGFRFVIGRHFLVAGGELDGFLGAYLYDSKGTKTLVGNSMGSHDPDYHYAKGAHVGAFLSPREWNADKAGYWILRLPR